MMRGLSWMTLIPVVALVLGVAGAAPAQSTGGCTATTAHAVDADATGLMIVVRGFRLTRSMAPAVLTSGGEVVYGRGWWKPGTVSPDVFINHGIVGYAHSIETARRSGSRPLVVTAVAVSGPPQSLAKIDVLVSDEDAERIRAANAKGRFLERFAVDFVIDK